jgi:pimeloyl-ACP methyl ester carboxylesterase
MGKTEVRVALKKLNEALANRPRAPQHANVNNDNHFFKKKVTPPPTAAINSSLQRNRPAPIKVPDVANFKPLALSALGLERMVVTPFGVCALAVDGPRGGPPVLLLHDVDAGPYVLRPLLHDLAEQGFRAGVLSFHGYGKSSPAQASVDLNMACHVVQARAALHYLQSKEEREERLGHAKKGAAGMPVAVGVFAHGTGAVAALGLANEDPEAVRFLVLLCPGGLRDRGFWARSFACSRSKRGSAESVRRRWHGDFFAAPDTGATRPIAVHHSTAFEKSLVDAPFDLPDAMVRTYADLEPTYMASRHKPWNLALGHAGRHPRPVFLCYGDVAPNRDGFDVMQVEAWHKFLPAAKLGKVRRGRHLFFLEQQAAFMSDLGSFLNEHNLFPDEEDGGILGRLTKAGTGKAGGQAGTPHPDKAKIWRERKPNQKTALQLATTSDSDNSNRQEAGLFGWIGKAIADTFTATETLENSTKDGGSSNSDDDDSDDSGNSRRSRSATTELSSATGEGKDYSAYSDSDATPLELRHHHQKKEIK